MIKMKRLTITILWITLMLLQGSAINAQRYQNGLIDKTIALIGNEMIMLSQLESEVKMLVAQGYSSDKNLRCEILENMLISKLFYNQALKDSLPLNLEGVEMEVNNRLNNIMTQLGGEKATETYFGKPIYKLKQDWREIFTEQSLTQDMQRNVASSAKQLTPSQIKEYFKKIPKDSLPIISTQYQFRQIVVYPDKEAAGLLVKERLLEMRERVLAGDRFSTLATMYSDDEGTAGRGGELGMAAKQIFWPAFSDAAMSLKVGQVSPIVETPDGYHLIQLIERNGDMFNARHLLMKPKYTDEDKSKGFERLDSIKVLINDETLDFSQAAKLFSEDLLSRTNGGLVADEMTGSPLFEMDRLKPEDYAVLKNMKIGEISEPFESTDNEGRGNTIYKIMKLEKIIPSHVANFDEDFSVLQEFANNEQSMEAIKKFVKQKQLVTYIVIDPLFQNCDFEYEGWIK